jgi:hypothetical protein
MENNLEDALIAGGLLGLIIIPFWVITQLSKKKIRSAMTARLAALAYQSKCQLSRSEQFGAKAIGLDENAGRVFFMDTHKNEQLMIDLTRVTACKLLKKMDLNAVRSIELQLINENGALSSIVPFYRRFIDDELRIPAVIKTAEKWKCLIHGLISSQGKPSGIKSYGKSTSNPAFRDLRYNNIRNAERIDAGNFTI